MSSLTASIYDLILEPFLKSWKTKIASWIGEDKNGPVLDICCGTGKQIRLIYSSSTIVGVDLNIEMLSFAKSKALHIPFVCADATNLPFKPNSFQNIVISLALHDKPEPVRRRMIDQATESLRSSGRLLLLDFEFPSTTKTRIGYSLIYLIELMAGLDHFSNGREFVKSGGLQSFAIRHNLLPKRKYISSWGSSSILKTALTDS